MKGCLIVSLGTPASTDPEDIKRFLHAFLSDSAVVDFPRWLWKPILNQIVLRVRPAKIAPQYEHIWLPEGSPLEVYTKSQVVHAQDNLDGIKVGYATTYTQPSIGQAIDDLDVDDLVLIPLFPHYAPSTVADMIRQATEHCQLPGRPRLTIAQSWETQPTLISYYQEKIRHALEHKPVDHIVFSYHGVPQRSVHEPDSYAAQCEATTHAIVSGLPDVSWEMTFQSKFGPGTWLGPATIDTMAELPDRGIHHVLVVSPGFFCDCIETLDELDVLNQDAFCGAGGREFNRILPPNDDPVTGTIIAEIYRQTIAS